ncbi:MAG: PHP domain-containing protein, partial [Chloroflexi bacterium]|nr:PHP domain-containing protein [Chloroflexota bacterium]
VTEKFETEEAFYARLGMQYIPPELREARGEIDAAETYSIPRLINQDDIRGDLHVHSGWTDGKGSVADMRDAARRMGYSYFAVTDHSHALGIARGLDQERLQQQVQEIRDLNNKDPSFMVLTGIEVDIKADGSLDLPDDVLESLDIVIASVHSSMHQPASEMTARVLRAIKNPHVDIIGHPTCRILGSRDPVSLDIEAVFQAAARSGTALEINSAPQRLDLKDIHAFRARELGIKIAVTSDAHNQEQFGFVRYGLGAARRGWCRRDDVLNCLPVEDLLQFFRRRRDN